MIAESLLKRDEFLIDDPEGFTSAIAASLLLYEAKRQHPPRSMIEPINFLVPLALLGLIVLAAIFFVSRSS